MAFYIEYNIRLFFFLLFSTQRALCAIDLDTILPVLFVSWLKKSVRVYDAHELFSEQAEIVSRKHIHTIWLWVENFAVPKFQNGFTVNLFIQQEFKRRFGLNYGIVRNIPVKTPPSPIPTENVHKIKENTFLYQGAVNKGRSFETLIPAMAMVDAHLLICGEGNFYSEVKSMIAALGLQEKITCLGYVSPNDLRKITPTCFCGITIFNPQGLNQYQSLANRFFDYMMAGIPQICVNYPEYKSINDHYQFALPIEDCTAESIAEAMNKLLKNRVIYQTLKTHAQDASQVLHWGHEEKTLIQCWEKALDTKP